MTMRQWDSPLLVTKRVIVTIENISALGFRVCFDNRKTLVIRVEAKSKLASGSPPPPHNLYYEGVMFLDVKKKS
jgi:hypothetical protein